MIGHLAAALSGRSERIDLGHLRVRAATVVAVVLLLAAAASSCGESPGSGAAATSRPSSPAARPGAYVYAVGIGNLVLRSADGGSTWQQAHRDSSQALAVLWAASFANKRRGWAAGMGSIIATQDGGVSWSTQYSGTTRLRLDDIACSDPQHAWAVGHRYQPTSGSRPTSAVILATSDGGSNWHAQAAPPLDWLRGVAFADARHGWAVGEEEERLGGVILATRRRRQALASAAEVRVDFPLGRHVQRRLPRLGRRRPQPVSGLDARTDASADDRRDQRRRRDLADSALRGRQDRQHHEWRGLRRLSPWLGGRRRRTGRRSCDERRRSHLEAGADRRTRRRVASASTAASPSPTLSTDGSSSTTGRFSLRQTAEGRGPSSARRRQPPCSLESWLSDRAATEMSLANPSDSCR